MPAFPPVQAFVFLDEHPCSINDGYFQVATIGNKFDDFPASFHNGCGSFSFADGHAEIKKWLASETKLPIIRGYNVPSTGIGVSSAEGLADLAWLDSHATY